MPSNHRTCTQQRSYTERVPRGRCLPPVPPTPNPRRGHLMKKKEIEENREESALRSNGLRSPRIVLVSKGGKVAPAHRSMPKWRKGYIRFKRKIKSGALVPLLLIVTVCGAGVHAVGLAGASQGYFSWSVACEGVVTVAGDGGRANGVQTYRLGWARYEGEGPSATSDPPTVNFNSNNGTAESDLGKGGIAGSSIAEQDWLFGIDPVSAVFGVLTAVGHVAGFVFYAAALFTAQRLFRSQFRSDRCVFRPAAKGAATLFVWTVGIGSVGWYLSARNSFTGSVLDILHSEDFLCQEDGSSIRGKFSFIATGFGCVASALMWLLTGWFGQVADLALSESFQRQRI